VDEWYEYLDIVPNLCAESLSIVCLDPAAATSKFLVFYQIEDRLYCLPVTIPIESRNNMSWPKRGNEGTRYPIPREAMQLGDATLIASGLLTGVRGGWEAQNYDADLFFSAVQSVAISPTQALLLYIENATVDPEIRQGDVYGRILTFDGATLTVGDRVAIDPTESARNLYQAVAGTDGSRTAPQTHVAFTTRENAGGGVYVLDCSGSTPTTIRYAGFSQDYSHVAWVGNFLAVLTKNSYSLGSAGGLDPSTAGELTGLFGVSPVEIILYDWSDMSVVGTIDADIAVASGIEQTGVLYGWADGRLFQHCATYDENEVMIGHVADVVGSGIRLWLIDDNGGVTLQDQKGWGDAEDQPCATLAYRWGTDGVLIAGPSDSSPIPGNEVLSFSNYFVGGVLKEANSDVQPYRLSDDWIVVTEPEKNSTWQTVPGVETEFWRNIETMWVRAIHLDSSGVPNIIGEPTSLYAIGGWYSVVGRIDDTHFLHIGHGLTSPSEATETPEGDAANFYHVVELNTTTGALSIVHEEMSTLDAESVPDILAYLSTPFQALQMGDTNKYVMLYTRSEYESGEFSDRLVVDSVPGLWLRTFSVGSDYTITVLDDHHIVGSDPGGGPFTERKPYDIIEIDSGKYVATWANTDPDDGGHFSSHVGVLVNSSGQITCGTVLRGEQGTFGNPTKYGIQGTWFWQGCGAHGRYVYPVDDWWDWYERYPPLDDSPFFDIFQRVPFTLMVMEVDDRTAELTYGYYPCRVDRDYIDTDWYDANEFFAPEPQRPAGSVSATTRIYQAHPDGGVYGNWQVGQVFPGVRDNMVWMFQGPFPAPWVFLGSTDLSGMTMVPWHLDDENQVAWYRGGDWGQFGNPYWVSYRNGAVQMRPGVFACFSTTSYHSRSSPQGYSAYFGTNLLRVWAEVIPRGVASVHDQQQNLWTYPGD
jgi:hypothetical protein